MLKNKSNQLSYIMITVKIKKNNFWYIFDPDIRVCDLNNGAQDTPLRQFSLDRLYLINSIFYSLDW